MLKVYSYIFLTIYSLNASGNSTKESNSTKDKMVLKNIQKTIANEKKFEKEQKFYMGDDYNLTEYKVDPKSLDKIKAIEPELDFDITDVYSD